MRRLKSGVAAMAGVAVAALLTTGAFAADANLTMVIYGTTGNPFWSKVVAGAEEAAKALGADVTIQFANDDPVQQSQLVEAALARGTTGIGLALNVDDAYDNVVKTARAQGVPVIAFNVDDSAGAAGNARQAFIGQDFREAGYLIGKAVAAEAGLKSGDKTVCPVEHPGAVYAVQRHEGVERAMKEVGATCEIIGTGGISLEDTLTKLTQYLVGHPDTKAVIGLGGMPTEMAPKAVQDARMSIPNGGFDLSEVIIQNVIDGKTLATVDQQPFYQGYMTVTQLYYAGKYGLTPASINTGAALVDKASAPIVLQLAKTVR
ncbi:MAG: substrate-binding domain-containing protein [Candidatus Kaistia colombiensis]|nr:MAG: substrate-binding domain-containing protein [Kaistia sp.]